MSRIAKAPIELPSGVDVNIVGQDVTVKGKNGSLSISLNEAVAVIQGDNALTLNPAKVLLMVGLRLAQHAPLLTIWLPVSQMDLKKT